MVIIFAAFLFLRLGRRQLARRQKARESDSGVSSD
jgi:hypothetical protein